jgi:very-short-patch-repair endonuclease/DNA polymerase III delta prime subunit
MEAGDVWVAGDVRVGRPGVLIATRTESDLLQRIQKTRRELLDLSARNRLISTPLGPSRGRKIEVVDERSEEVFRLLVRDGKSMSFLPGLEVPDPTTSDQADSPRLTQPEEEEKASVDGAPDPRHVDLRLQTRLTSERLQARLLSMYYDAQTYEQEQGVSILYLAMGFLKWYESPSSDKARYAPLLLIPVDLERPTAASRFTLKHREEDVATNLSLQEKLRAEFGIDLPDVPDLEELSPGAYFDAVSSALTDQPRWEVLRDDIVVWFFSFAKYLMYRDLDPATWPEHSPLGNNPTLSNLLGEGFASEPPLCGESDKIDALISAADMVHVTDADSSQAVAIEEVRRGRHLVIQGPPGTGKSQTITNLIATAVKEGKKVLFVAEKMAALDVVHSRLERLGLGAICLELHSNKANKKTVLEEIARTLALGRPKAQFSEESLEALQSAIDGLNRHAEVMNTPIEPAGFTPYQIIGRLARLYAQGIEATNVPLPEPETWSGSRFREHCRALTDLRKHLEEIGTPGEHPWRGVNRTEPLLPTDMKELQDGIAEAIGSLTGLAEASSQLADAFHDIRTTSPSLKQVQLLAQCALRIVKSPTMDRHAIGHPAWAGRRDELTRLVERGRAHAESVAGLRDRWAEAAWQVDFSATRQSLETHGRSLFRWFRREYRDSIASLRRLLKVELPKTLAERLRLVDSMIEAQEGSRSLDQDPILSQLGRDAFGEEWKGSKSAWDSLAEILKWESECREARFPWDHREILSRLERPDILKTPLGTVSGRLKASSGQLQEIARTLALDWLDSFGVDSPYAVPIADLVERLRGWQRHPESLSKWIGYGTRRRRLEAAGLGGIISEIHEGRIAATVAVDQFQVAYYQTLIRAVFRSKPELAEFDGRSHEQWIEEFRSLDCRRIEMARGEVATAHYDAIPRLATGGEMAVLRREFEKKRRHKPIRQLVKEAGTAILAIKPVFMMSPISVAQFLEPGSVSFDLLLIDEASQVSPVDALGAMARAGQVVVVGDDKQLPPTRFFSKMLDEDDVQTDDDDLNPGDLESILGLCIAQGMAQRMLRWHYRSRHHSLIAVSNREFYDNHLHVVPSPTTVTAMHGLHFRPVSGGVFDRGNSATNRVEARAVAEAVIEHARRSPGQSLGVGAFSVSQRDAIRDELEVLQREHPELAEFFGTGRAEPFFVKNLENIQGDERDVIFISVGYARDSSGYMAMNFGPLSAQGGERRLNVLISRAKARCEVFSSITADDIDLQRAKSRGAACFKTFLRYAATGILDSPAPTGGDFDSDFERQVAVALEGLGYVVHCQVGTAGFLIDLAIVDSSQPGRYLLGIECDGATYHSSRSARDRDRMREAVLRDRGWKIHRVWSTDWFHRPGEQTQKIVAAIDKARIDLDADEEAEIEQDVVSRVIAPAETDIERVEESEATDGDVRFTWASPYVEAKQAVPSSKSIPETKLSVLAKIVAEVVDVEGPIHKEEIARRITSLWGQQRTGARIAEAISKAIDKGVDSGSLLIDADFVTHGGQSIVPVRDRSEVSSANLKKPEMIAPSELRQAILHLVTEQVGLRRDELPTLVGRVLGFKATSPKLKETVEKVLAAMLEKNEVESRDQKLFTA